MSSRSTPSPLPPESPSLSNDRQSFGEGNLVPTTPASVPKHDVVPDRKPASGRSGYANREDCWSEEATRTLIDAWGSHYLQVNRGNLRQKHWKAVADAVNVLGAASAKQKRTDVQCKNRIDTIKKKYKIEKAKVAESKGRYVSTWPHFRSLDSFIGHSFSKTNGNKSDVDGHSGKPRRRVSSSSEKSSSPETRPKIVGSRCPNSPLSHHRIKDPAVSHLPRWSVPVGPRSKRTGPATLTERNFSVMAAAAAAMEAEKDDEYEEEEEEENSGAWRRPSATTAASGMKRARVSQKADTFVGEGYQKLAEAIAKLAQIYEKVEEGKQRQMVELEKQRIQFSRDLELQRMQIFVESQLQLEKLKRAKPNS